MLTILADIRYAHRLLAKNLGLTAIIVISLALAIGANTAIFSMANELLFARLSVPRAVELRSVFVVHDMHGGGQSSWNSYGDSVGGLSERDVLSYPAFQLLLRQQTSEPLFGYQNLFYVSMNGTGNEAGNPQAVSVQMVSGSFYGQMEVRPMLGRPLGPTDDHVDRGAPLAAVLSYGLWQRAFGGATTLLGRTIRLNGALATIVGVNPPGFTGAASVQISPDVFVPLTAVVALQPLVGNEKPLSASDLDWVKVGFRANPGISDSAIAAHLTVAFAAAIRATKTLKANQTLPWIAIKDGSRGLAWTRERYGKPVYALLGLVLLVLLLACVNVANLMLGRARTRSRELSLRMALGASRIRVFRQLLVESLLLASIGGALGLLLAYAVRNVVPRLLWAGADSSTLVIPFHLKVFAFTAGITVLSAVLSGLAPAWQATRSQPGEALKSAGLSATGRRRFLGGKLLVALEVALSLVLVAGAALFLRTMINLQSVHTGFNARGLLLFDVNLPQLRYPADKTFPMHQQLLAAMRQVPGVESASLATVPLLANSLSNGSFHLEQPGGKQAYKDEGEDVDRDAVTPDFFRTMQIPILAGRGFTEADSSSTRHVAVVNEALVRRFFANANPIGRAFRTSDKGSWTQIIGICADTRYEDPHAPPPPIHFDLLSHGNEVYGGTYILRTTVKPDSVVPSLRRVAARLDPSLPLINIRTQEEQIAQVTRQERLMATLSLGFGALALLLASVGVYGLLSYKTAERTREIGIRLALGAQQSEVRRMILHEAAVLAAAGLAVGLGITLVLTRLVRSMLYGVAPNDPAALAGAAALLFTLAIVAAWLPARRAASIDPVIALRSE